MRTVTIARTTTPAVVVLTVLVGLLPADPAGAATRTDRPAAATKPPATKPPATKPAVRKLINQSAVGQLITVTATSRTVTYATFRAYQVTGTRRTEVFGPWTARVGYNGIAALGRKREGDGRTPSGTYRFSFFFGVDPSPGVAFPYRHAYTYDYWDDDPVSPRYNEWVDARTASPGRNPEPMHNVPAYDYAAVIAYNTARTPGLGSAIFLHVGTGTATAGCVSLPVTELLKVLRWLNPADSPKIDISTG
jgi:L,D-peptidoglycan transpeptidase YkuD (ErfK/YbiS/YcfS/YnhG family)